MDKSSRIYVAGDRGLVGSAILRRLAQLGYENLITRTRDELDLTRQAAVDAFFAAETPHYVFLAAAKVGGILVNSERPATFIRDNLLIQTLVIDAAHRHGVRKLLYLGSSCIYPKHAPQPMREEHLLTGVLEPTNEAYAVAKIAGIKMCEAYGQQHGFDTVALMPTNLYGPGDNFDLRTSHVLPALLRRIHEAHETGASEVVVWGTGEPLREFLYVDDLADACEFVMRTVDGPRLLNVGVGKDISIRDLAELIASVVGYTGTFTFDTAKPDGTPRKLLDVTQLTALGWTAQTELRDGIERAYAWYRANQPVGKP